MCGRQASLSFEIVLTPCMSCGAEKKLTNYDPVTTPCKHSERFFASHTLLHVIPLLPAGGPRSSSRQVAAQPVDGDGAPPTRRRSPGVVSQKGNLAMSS